MLEVPWKIVRCLMDELLICHIMWIQFLTKCCSVSHCALIPKLDIPCRPCLKQTARLFGRQDRSTAFHRGQLTCAGVGSKYISLDLHLMYTLSMAHPNPSIFRHDRATQNTAIIMKIAGCGNVLTLLSSHMREI